MTPVLLLVVASFASAPPSSTASAPARSGGPIIAANYFLSLRGAPGAPIGEALRLGSGPGGTGSGSWGETGTPVPVSSTGDGAARHLLQSQPESINALKKRLSAVGGKPMGALILRIDFHLSVADNRFSAEPVARIEIVGRRGDARRPLSVREVYPQDFRAEGVSEPHALLMADYVPEAEEEVELGVWWHGRGSLSVHSIDVVPLPFTGFFGSWSGMPWKGGTETGHFCRQFDPMRVVTSRFRKDGKPEPLPAIDWWRRDIVVGAWGQYPYIGVYDQANPELLRYQVRQARAAGIDAFKVYLYYGTRVGAAQLEGHRWEWKAMDDLLDVCAEEGFRIFINDSTISERTWIGGSYGHADAVHNLHLVTERGWLDHAGYLHVDGRPVYDLPAIGETDPAKLGETAEAMNRAYRQASKRNADLYLWCTAMSTFIVRNEDGPYNMQAMFMDSYYMQEDRWKRYFVCEPPPKDAADLMSRGRCRYEPSAPASGYGLFLATLLEREHLAGFRRVPGITGFYDWTGNGASIWPQYLAPKDGRYQIQGEADPRLSAKAFRIYVEDAHKHGYAAAISVVPGHDKSNTYKDVGYVLTPRFEADGRAIRFRRLMRDALGARPDFILIENWNGYGEAVQIAPCCGFVSDVTGEEDPDIYLKIVAESLGRAYVPPAIPPGVVDPVRLSHIPRLRLGQPEAEKSNDQIPMSKE